MKMALRAMEEAETVTAKPTTMTADLCAPLLRNQTGTGEMMDFYATKKRSMLSMSVMMTSQMRARLRVFSPPHRGSS